MKKKIIDIPLFAVIDREIAKEEADAGNCQHLYERKDECDWPNRPNDPRMVWVCETCGRMRGRCP